MKTLLTVLLSAFATCLYSQSIVGEWQLVKQSTCMEENMKPLADSTQQLVNDMKSRGSATASTITFKDNQAGEESTRILNSRKSGYSKNFLYKFDGEMLMVLDKRSRTITDNYIVEKFSTDSLILANASRPCETKIFLKISKK
jgi:Lipocalin-like domain